MTCTTDQCGTGSYNGPSAGDPDNSSVLTATGEFGGIRLSWTLPNVNSFAVAHTHVYRNTVGNVSSAVRITTVNGSGYFDSSAAETIREYFYWIQHVSINGTTLDYIGPASAIARPDVDRIISLLANRIEMSQLATTLRSRIERITDLEAGLTQTNSVIETETGILAQELLALRSDLTGAIGYINSQTQIELTARQAMVTTINTQLAQFNDTLYAAIADEAITRASETGELFAQKTLRIDLAGNVSGYGLSAHVDPNGTATSDFQVRADTFSIAPPAINSPTAPSNPFNGKVWVDTSVTPNVAKWYNTATSSWQTTPVKGAVPFIVKTTPEVIDGVTIPAGVYMDTAYISKLTADKIDTRGLTIKDAAGNILFGSGVKIDYTQIAGLGSLANQNSVPWASVGNKPYFGAFSSLDQMNAANIANYMSSAAIAEAYIQNGAITNAKIADAAITAAKIGFAEVDTLRIGGEAVMVNRFGEQNVYGLDLNTSYGSDTCSVVFTISGLPSGDTCRVLALAVTQAYPSNGDTTNLCLGIFGDGWLSTEVRSTFGSSGITMANIANFIVGNGSYTVTTKVRCDTSPSGTSFKGSNSFVTRLIIMGAKR